RGYAMPAARRQSPRPRLTGGGSGALAQSARRVVRLLGSTHGSSCCSPCSWPVALAFRVVSALGFSFTCVLVAILIVWVVRPVRAVADVAVALLLPRGRYVPHPWRSAVGTVGATAFLPCERGTARRAGDLPW